MEEQTSRQKSSQGIGTGNASSLRKELPRRTLRRKCAKVDRSYTKGNYTRFTKEQEKYIIELLTDPGIVRNLSSHDDPTLHDSDAYGWIERELNKEFNLYKRVGSVYAKVWYIRKRFIETHKRLLAEDNPGKREQIQKSFPYYSILYKHYKDSPIWLGEKAPKRGGPRRSRLDVQADESQHGAQPIDNTDIQRIECESPIIIIDDDDDTRQNDYCVDHSNDHPDNLPVSSMTLSESSDQDCCQKKEQPPTATVTTATHYAFGLSHFTSVNALSRSNSETQDHCPAKRVAAAPSFSSFSTIPSFPITPQSMSGNTNDPRSWQKTPVFGSTSFRSLSPYNPSTTITPHSAQGRTMPRCTTLNEMVDGLTKRLSGVRFESMEELGYTLFQMIDDHIERESKQQHTS